MTDLGIMNALRARLRANKGAQVIAYGVNRPAMTRMQENSGKALVNRVANLAPLSPSTNLCDPATGHKRFQWGVDGFGWGEDWVLTD